MPEEQTNIWLATEILFFITELFWSFMFYCLPDFAFGVGMMGGMVSESVKKRGREKKKDFCCTTTTTNCIMQYSFWFLKDEEDCLSRIFITQPKDIFPFSFLFPPNITFF